MIQFIVNDEAENEVMNIKKGAYLPAVTRDPRNGRLVTDKETFERIKKMRGVDIVYWEEITD